MNDKASEEALTRIIEAAKELEWCIAIPDMGDEEELPYIIMGTEAGVDKVLSCLPDGLHRKQ